MKKTIREQLQDEHPELYEALKRSAKIAEEEWLPAIETNRGSFNSHPHIRNLESYLDQIYQDAEGLPIKHGVHVFRMNPVEKYMMLSCILFHDIGRTHVGADCHAAESRDILQSKSAELGIPSKQVAYSLARICYSHDPEEGKWRDAWGKLQETTIAPYGLVREKPLATLLCLVDHLDSAHTRVIPHYLTEQRADSSILLRGQTNGTRVDLKNQMVLVSIPDREPTIYCPTSDDIKNATVVVKIIEEKGWFNINKKALEDVKEIPGLHLAAVAAYEFQRFAEAARKDCGELDLLKGIKEELNVHNKTITELLSKLGATPEEENKKCEQCEEIARCLDALLATLTDIETFFKLKKKDKSYGPAIKKFSDRISSVNTEPHFEEKKKGLQEINASLVGWLDVLVMGHMLQAYIKTVKAIMLVPVVDYAKKMDEECRRQVTGFLKAATGNLSQIAPMGNAERKDKSTLKNNINIIVRFKMIFDVLAQSTNGTWLCWEIECHKARVVHHVEQALRAKDRNTLFKDSIKEAMRSANDLCRLVSDNIEQVMKPLGSVVDLPETKIKGAITYASPDNSLGAIIQEGWKTRCKTILGVLACLKDGGYAAIPEMGPVTELLRDEHGDWQHIAVLCNTPDEPRVACQKYSATTSHKSAAEQYRDEFIARIDKFYKDFSLSIQYDDKENLLKIVNRASQRSAGFRGQRLERDFIADGYLEDVDESTTEHEEGVTNKWKDPRLELVRAADLNKREAHMQGGDNTQICDVQKHSCALPYYLISRGLFFCKNVADLLPLAGKGDGAIPEILDNLMVPVILSNTRENGQMLETVGPELAALGLPLRGWLLERNEHLYNCGGFETFEPIFDRKYLQRVAEAMCDLWCGTLDLKPISYEYLAAELRDNDLHRVTTAVRRIAIIGRYRRTDSDAKEIWSHSSGGGPESESTSSRPTIRHTVSGWSWIKGALSREAICARIEFLKDPQANLRIEQSECQSKVPKGQGESRYIRLGAPLDELFNDLCPSCYGNAPAEGGNRENDSEHGALRIPSAHNPGTGNIVILGKAGTGKSTFAMQIAAESVRRNEDKNIYAAYISLEESREHIFSKVHNFGWGDLLAPVNVPQLEAYGRSVSKLACELRNALNHHCCRRDAEKPSDPGCRKSDCRFNLFCSHRDPERCLPKGTVLLPKLFPFSFGKGDVKDEADQLFQDRYRQLESLLEAVVWLRDETDGAKDIRIVCIDSLNVLGRGGMTRDHLASLFDLFKRHEVMGVFVLEDTARGIFAGESELDEETIEFLADTVVELTGQEEEGCWVRHFQIKKSRYQDHVPGRHPFRIHQFAHTKKEPKALDEEWDIYNGIHKKKSIHGLHIVPSTHHINKKRGESPTGEPTQGDHGQKAKIWTDPRLDTQLVRGDISDKAKDGADRSVFAVVGPATSGKSVLAKNYLLQGLLSDNPRSGRGKNGKRTFGALATQGHSLLIRFASNCDQRAPEKFFFVHDKECGLQFKTVKAEENSDAVKTVRQYLDPVLHTKVALDVYHEVPTDGKGKKPLHVSLALEPGFLLPGKVFEIIQLLFEWAHNSGAGYDINRVVLYDVSAIGHSYPLLRRNSIDSDLFLPNLVQLLRSYGASVMMVASRSSIPESESVVEKVISLADHVIVSNHLDVFGDMYITYTGPGSVQEELNRGDGVKIESDSVPAVLREYGTGKDFKCYKVDFDALEGLVGFSTGHIRRPGVSMYMFEEGLLQKRYNDQIGHMLKMALAAPEQEKMSVGQQFYPDVDFIRFFSRESEAIHNGVNLLGRHPLHRTVVRTIDEFAIDGDDNGERSKNRAGGREESESRIYYKNVLVLLVSDPGLKEKTTWKELEDRASDKGTIEKCFYDRSARETLTAGVLDSLTMRGTDGKDGGNRDLVWAVPKRGIRSKYPPILDAFQSALRFFAKATPFRVSDPKDASEDTGLAACVEALRGEGECVILCWYTQARYLIKRAQEGHSHLGDKWRVLALPHGGFRGDWYLEVAPDSVSPSLGKQISLRLLRHEEQMKRFFDGVGLPAWHRFGETDLYLNRYVNPSVQTELAVALGFKDVDNVKLDSGNRAPEILDKIKRIINKFPDGIRQCVEDMEDERRKETPLSELLERISRKSPPEALTKAKSLAEKHKISNSPCDCLGEFLDAFPDGIRNRIENMTEKQRKETPLSELLERISSEAPPEIGTTTKSLAEEEHISDRPYNCIMRLIEYGQHFIEDTNRTLPAFRGSSQKVHQILRVHAQAKKRSEFGNDYERDGQSTPGNRRPCKRQYKDIHAELYFVLKDLVQKYTPTGGEPDLEEVKDGMNKVIALCNLEFFRNRAKSKLSR